jgi:hypothetical protein
MIQQFTFRHCGYAAMFGAKLNILWEFTSISGRVNIFLLSGKILAVRSLCDPGFKAMVPVGGYGYVWMLQDL